MEPSYQAVDLWVNVSWWERLARRIANEYRVRRAEREVAVLDERTLCDIGLEYAARFGRA